MSSQPAAGPEPLVGLPHPLTVVEYLEIAEVERGHTELVEGRLLLSPSPKRRHSRACSKLWTSLDDQIPPEFEVVEDIDVDLRLNGPAEPGTVRRPDLVVSLRAAALRVDEEGEVYHASDLVLAIEVVSPGSVRADHQVKRAEYADAGIPHYWIVDLDEPASLIACHLAGEFGAVTSSYGDPGATSGVFRTSEPFPFEIDLDALLD